MKNFKNAKRLIAAIIVIVILAWPLLAQTRHNAPKKPVAVPAPTPTFDSLLAADSYNVYCEVRGVGGLIRSSAVNDLLDPLMKLGGPPKEFKSVLKWLNAHADALAGSRMMVAGWRSRPELPNVLVALEFSSPEEAKKFYPELRDFLPQLLPTPTPTPSPVPAPIPDAKPAPTVSASPDTQAVRAELIGEPMPSPQDTGNVAKRDPEPNLPPYQMKQAGSLILISDTAFKFRSLKPRGSKPLEEDQNFLVARNRFASESVFLYVDLKSIQKEEDEQRKKWQEEEQKRIEAEAANPPKAEESPAEAVPEISAPPIEEETPPPAELESSAPLDPVVVAPSDPNLSNNASLSGTPGGAEEAGPMFSFASLYGTLFGGESKWPEAVGAALVFEGDAYVVRTLIINSAENKGNAIPFLPRFVSGPAIVPESTNIFPADIDLFVSVSLDYPQIYDEMLKAITKPGGQYGQYRGAYKTDAASDDPPRESPFAAHEKKLGLKIKDDLLPLLGNELALALPRKAIKAATSSGANPESGDVNQPRADQGPDPVIAISIKDREAVGRLIPKIIKGFGLK
ncbi:MAG: hypothetical protein ACREA9_12445, partial [Pyrinomonadaceae bacterium]